MHDMKIDRRSGVTAHHRSRRRPRPYQQAARAEQTAAHRGRIVQVAVSLVHAARHISEITLEEVARRSGVTVRTILRHFGSRDGMLEAAFAQISQKMRNDRPPSTPGDVDAALAALLKHYELDGDPNIKAL